MHFNRFPMGPVLLAVTLLAGCGTQVQNPVTGQVERSVMSESQEVAEGQKAHAQVLQEYTELANPKVQAYVNDIGQRLAAKSQRAQLKWTFTVLDSPEINAFALPGGYVYITRGIMAYLDSEADLAGVIGHEIGHVTARHGAQRATKAQTGQGVAVLGGILGAVLQSKGYGGLGSVVSDGAQTVAAGYVARYGRDQELQADGLGAEYLARTNWDPRNMIDVINVLKNQERFAADTARAEGRAAPQPNSWLASHPSNDARLDAITKLAAQYKDTGKYANEARTRYLQMLSGVAFGESAEQGVTRGNQFFHEGMGIALTAPAGWKIQNEPEQVAVVSSTGDAAMLMRVAPKEAGATHEQVLRNYLKAEGRSDRLHINGLAVTRFVGNRQSAQGQVQPLAADLFTGPGNAIFVLIQAGKDAAATQRATPGFAQVAGSFRAMTAADKAAARPWALSTVALPRGGFAELAKSSPLSAPEQQLRLINGVYGGGELPAGSLVKLVR